MTIAIPKAGYKGKVKVNNKQIGGATTWSYGGGVRQMQAIDQLGDEVVTDLPLQIVGGDITITGNYLMHADAGQQLLKTLFDSGEQLKANDLKLFISDKDGDNIYHTPDDGTEPESYATVTNYDNIGDDKSGVGTFTCTMKMSGKLKPMGVTALVQVVTTGVHGITTTGAELVGELVSTGGAGDRECYFKYGETSDCIETTYEDKDVLTAAGLFGTTLAELTPDKLYYYRAVVKHNTTLVYGAIKTFTTEESL